MSEELNRDALVCELKACDMWDLMFYRKRAPDLEDHIAFANRQIRRREIIGILSLEKLYKTTPLEMLIPLPRERSRLKARKVR